MTTRLSCPSHCCLRHGCKYGYDDCPVVLKVARQQYPCEHCPELKEVETELAELEAELRFQRELRNVRPPDMRCGSCGERLVPKQGTYVFGAFRDEGQWTNNYTHAGPMLDRHGAWPVEVWEDD